MARLARWEPFRDLMSLREAMDRLFEESVVRPREGWVTTQGASTLAVDMYETEENVIVKTALPGINAEDVEVSVVGDVLTIRGESKQEEEIKEGNYLLRERRYGTWTRALRLPEDVLADEATADFKDGVLTLTLPKAAETQPKRIEVKVG